MENVGPKRRARLPLVFTCATLVLIVAGQVAAQSDPSSGGSSFGHSIANGFQNLGRSATPPPGQADDPIALSKKAKTSVELYIALAHLYAEGGKFTEAEDQYKLAMKKGPDDIRVLLGYAMLKDQMNQPQEAMKFYQQAEKKHPTQPAVYNNLAIHYARNGMVREAIGAAQRAVELRPREPRYCNNLAALLVEADMPQEAFKRLREIYDEPVAHYDLGFLLNKRGMKAAALQEFTITLRLNPGMTSARQWVERLSRERSESNSTAIGMPPPPGQSPPGAISNLSPQRPEFQSAPSPRQYLSPPQYFRQAPPPAQAQYPAPVQYPMNTGPQYMAAPQNQNPAYNSAVNPTPVMAARDPSAAGVRMNQGPAADGSNNPRRLPPVNDPSRWAEPNRDSQNPDLVAPDPPNWRR